MQYIIEFLLVTICFINICLGFFVLFKKSKAPYSGSFFILTFGISLWVISNFFFQKTLDPTIAYTLDTLANYGALFLLVGLYFFSKTFPKKLDSKPILNKYSIFIIIIAIILCILIGIPGIIDKEVAINSENIRSLIVGPLKPVYYLFLLLNIISSSINFFRSLNKLTGLFKLQMRIFLISFFASAVGGVFFNIILPLTGNYTLVNLGPLSVFIFSLASVYCMMNYRYTDFKVLASIVIESLLSSSIIVGIIFLVQSISDTFFKNDKLAFSILSYIVLFSGCVYAFTKYRDNAKKKYIFAQDLNYYISNFEKESLKISSKDELIHELKEIFKKSIHVVEMEIVLSDEEDKNVLLNQFSALFSQYNTSFFIIDEERKKYFDKMQEDNALIDNLESFQETYHYDSIFRMEYLDKKIGLVFLKKLNSNITFSTYEVDFIVKIIELFSIFLYKLDLYETNLEINKVLQEKVEKATKILESQKEELKVKYQVEKDMMGIMGHELRTPLTTARGFLEIVTTNSKMNPDTPLSTQNHYLENVFSALKREIDLVQTMLSTSHVDNDKLKIDPVEIDLEGIIKNTMLDYVPEAAKKNLTLEYHEIENLPHIKCDPGRTVEVTNNLVSNAIKYTPKGRVDIFVSFDDQFVYFHVKDTGEGIAPEEIPNIGKKFYRVQNYLSADKSIVRPGGTGLGMYVVKAILMAAGGELRIESKVGEGSTFTAVFVRWNPNHNVS